MTTPKPALECSFPIPVRRDAELSDGEPHPRAAWRWLERVLFEKFEGGTRAPGLYWGFYRSDSGKKVIDASHKYFVALPKSKLGQLRSLLFEVCEVFAQKCVYLSVAGQVELVVRKKHGPA
jgi:hypothetical protein